MNENIEGRYPEYIFDGVRLVRADRSPCPICSHPTGDCSGDNSEPRAIVGLGIFKSVDENITITVEEDIWEEKQINPFYTARVLLARKGQKIPVTKARELGLL